MPSSDKMITCLLLGIAAGFLASALWLWRVAGDVEREQYPDPYPGAIYPRLLGDWSLR